MFSVTLLKHKGNMLKPNKVTVYSCSGCSNVAQLANSVAVKLDRTGIAKMSCVVGIGGDVPSLVKFAEKSEKILVLDGCPLQCARKCLERHNIVPTVHLVLTEDGLVKNISEDVPTEIVEEYFNKVKLVIKDIENDG
jgi:uncharacterized metal-binding protein